MTSAIPVNDAERLAALYRYDVLDRPLQAELEGVARLAQLVSGAPIARVNLIDADRQFTACILGGEAEDVPRTVSMCALAIQSPEVTYTPDASQDSRFMTNGFVTGELAEVRLYAAAPLLTSDNLAMGTLCVVDEQSRELTEEQLTGLRDLAEQLMTIFELRRHSHLLARANTELDEFAGTVAHDLRNPLAAATGYAEMAVDFVLAGSPMAGETLNRLHRTLGRMSELVDDVLNYARTTQGRLLVTKVDLNDIAQVALENLHSLLSKRGGDIRIGPLPVLEADGVQLLQLLQNLMANALLHGVGRESLRIGVSAVDAEGGYLLHVDDNGAGITPADRDRVFGAFERAVTTAEGTGLGLATCQRIAQRHGGRIWVEDSPLGGARLSVFLPSESPEWHS